MAGQRAHTRGKRARGQRQGTNETRVFGVNRKASFIVKFRILSFNTMYLHMTVLRKRTLLKGEK